jgi:hypothetical protein
MKILSNPGSGVATNIISSCLPRDEEDLFKKRKSKDGKPHAHKKNKRRRKEKKA